MNALIKIEARDISGASVQTCNARELWQFVESRQDFSDWITNRIEKYGFVEGEDFSINLWKTPEGGRPRKDYHLTLETAKELAMVENNEKGRQVRRYFIECERQAKAASNIDPMQILSDPTAMRGLLLTYTEKVLTLESKVGELAPKAQAFEMLEASNETLTYTQAAKVIGMNRKDLIATLHRNGWHFRQNGSWVAYDQYIKNGCLQYKEAKYTDESTGLEVIKPYCHITQKGLARLAHQGVSHG